jgi:N-glycosylase/DNA lyase
MHMTIHEQIVAQYEAYIAENQKFTVKGVKASAARARKALGELAKLAKERRKEIQDEKNEA